MWASTSGIARHPMKQERITSVLSTFNAALPVVGPGERVNFFPIQGSRVRMGAIGFSANLQGLNPVLDESRKKSADARNRFGDGRFVYSLKCGRVKPLMVEEVIEARNNHF
jgi:hypothetical protein